MLKTMFRAALIGMLLCAAPAFADAVSDAAAVARVVKGFADAAAAQVPIADAALRDTQTAAAQGKAAADRASQAESDADNAKQRADKNAAAAKASADEAARMRKEAELAAKAGLCAKAKVAAAAAQRAATAADSAANAIAPEIPATIASAAAAERAQADALAAKKRAQLAAKRTLPALAAAEKAAGAANAALANAYGKSATVAEVGTDLGDGNVPLSDANYRLFQDGVADGERANKAASDVRESRQLANVVYNVAFGEEKSAADSVKHIRAIQTELIDAKTAALRDARQALADADAAKKAVAGCTAASAGQPAPPPPGPPGTSGVRSYPSFTHRQTDCASCRALAAELNRETDRYNALENSDPDKEGAMARVRALADRLSECERRCPPADRPGMPEPRPGMEPPPMPGRPGTKQAGEMQGLLYKSHQRGRARG